MKETEIIIKVKLDQNNIPEEITWSAPDGGMKDQISKAIFLSFWDSNQKETLKLNLEEGAYKMLYSGKWDATSQLLDEEEKINNTVRNLPYLNNFE